MKKRDWMLLGILLAGNLLVWADRLVTAVTPVGFDFKTFEQDVRRTFDKSQLVARPFVAGGLVPESHLHLRAEDKKDPLYSVYLGQYPRLGILAAEPHDPEICYQAAGYGILSGPEDVFVQAGGSRHALRRIEVSGWDVDGKELTLTTYYWHQLAGRMPGTGSDLPGPFAQARARYVEGRSDLVWVRVELRGSGKHLDTDLQQRLLALMHSAATAMRRQP
ncbi:MAG: hypothetical protein ACYS5W_18380 [Planctomycetota bacterium]|jgi:hypothetical protein